LRKDSVSKWAQLLMRNKVSVCSFEYANVVTFINVHFCGKLLSHIPQGF
jgi:hypothetical protein